jgi:hypothetical protein
MHMSVVRARALLANSNPLSTGSLIVFQGLFTTNEQQVGQVRED